MQYFPTPYWPITLVGSAVSAQNSIKNIVEVQIILNSPQHHPQLLQHQHPCQHRATSELGIYHQRNIRGNNGPQPTSNIQAREAQRRTLILQVKSWAGTPLHHLVIWGREQRCHQQQPINLRLCSQSYRLRWIIRNIQ